MWKRKDTLCGARGDVIVVFEGVLSIVVPVYNEESTVMSIIEKLESLPIKKQIILVDDYSTDMTRNLLQSVSSNVQVILHEKNMGKGAAIRTGLSYATGDAAIIQDADMEYSPTDMLPMLAKLGEGHMVVYGSRFMGKNENMTVLHNVGNRLLTSLTNILLGTRLTDMETCYKLLRSEVYRNIRIESNRFNMEPEITAKIARMGYEITEVPINYSARGVNDGKKISWKDGFSAVAALLRYRFGPVHSVGGKDQSALDYQEP